MANLTGTLGIPVHMKYRADLSATTTFVSSVHMNCKIGIRVINYQIFSEKYVLSISTHNLINAPVIWLSKYCNYNIFLYKFISLN